MLQMRLTELNNKIYKAICDRLDVDSSWRYLVEAVSKSIYQLNDIEREKCARELYSGNSPAVRLLHQWDSRGMTVETLCFYLDKLKYEDCLKFIKAPVSLKIVQQPAEEIRTSSGKKLEISCLATGFPYPEYVWYRGNTRISTDKVGKLIINRPRPSDSGTYACRVQHYTETGGWSHISSTTCKVEVAADWTDDFSSGLSLPKDLKSRASVGNVVTYLPKIILQPTNKVSGCGGPVIFKVVAEHPTNRLNYEWFFNNIPIHNATGNEYRIEDVSKEHAGSYQARIFSKINGKVQTMSRVAKLEVNPEPNQFTAADKLALLIGNSSYRSYGQPLPAVEFDLYCTTEALEKMGFKVIALLDLTLKEMKRAVDFFCSLLTEDVYAIFYCMGHGFLYNNKHYLIPWDSSQGNDVNESLCIEACMKKMQDRPPRLLMLLIDLCRQQVEHSQIEEIPKEKVQRGVPNYVIIYAAILGEQSFEVSRCSGNPRGLFNRYLLEVLVEPRVRISAVFSSLQEKFRKCPYNREKFPQNPQMDITLREPERSLWDPIFDGYSGMDGRMRQFHHTANKDIWQQAHVIPGNVHIPLENKALIVLSFSKYLSNVLLMGTTITNFDPKNYRIEVELQSERVNQVLQPIKTIQRDTPEYKFCNLQRLENNLTISLKINIVGSEDRISKLETELIDLGRPLTASPTWLKSS